MSDNKGFINVFNRKAKGFHRQAKLFELNFFMLLARWSNQADQILLSADQFA